MKQHETIIEEDSEECPSEMVKHHHSTNWQCMFQPGKAFIVDNETNYWKRRKKEAIYSMMNNSINKCDSIDNGWNNILYQETKRLKDMIKFRKQHYSLHIPTVKGQDGNTGTDE